MDLRKIFFDFERSDQIYDSCYARALHPVYSTVTLLARLRGWSTFRPFTTAT